MPKGKKQKRAQEEEQHGQGVESARNAASRALEIKTYQILK